MKKLFLLLMTALLVSGAPAQQLVINATHYIGGYGAYEAASDIHYDPRDKSLVFCGWADSCGSGDLVPKPAHLLSGREKVHMVLGKIDSNRNLQWIRMYGGSQAAEQAFNMKVLPLANGGYTLLGMTYSSDGDATGGGHHGGTDVWLVRTDASGNLLWQKCFGGVGDEGGMDVKQTSDGGFIFVGGTTSPVSGDVDVRFGPAYFDGDWIVVKTDSFGNKQWVKIMGGSANEGYAKIFQLGSSYFMICGSQSHNNHCSDNPSGIACTNFRLIKLDSTGNYLWNKGYGSMDCDQFSDGLWDERDGTFVMLGITGAGGVHVPSSPNMNWQRAWVLKMDTAGTIRWSKVYGDTLTVDRYSSSITPIAQNGGYAVAVETGLDPQGPVPPGYFGERDVQIRLLDSAGNQTGEKKLGGIGKETRPKMLQYPGGNLLTGVTSSASMNEGTNIGSLKGASDIYISYLDLWPTNAPYIEARPARGLTVFPNPATSTVTLVLDDATGGRLRIVHGSGAVVHDSTVKKGIGRITLSTERWSRGSYIVQWIPANAPTRQTTLILQ